MTDAEAEAPVFWPPEMKSWLIRKGPDAGKDWGQEEKETTEDEMVGWHHQLDGYDFEQVLGDGTDKEAWCVQSVQSQRIRHDWATKQQQASWKSMKNKEEHFVLLGQGIHQ